MGVGGMRVGSAYVADGVGVIGVSGVHAAMYMAANRKEIDLVKVENFIEPLS